MTKDIIEKGIGSIAWRIAREGAVDDTQKAAIVADFLDRAPVLVVPNAFKENMSAGEAADLIERGIRSVIPQATIRKHPTADGGDGTREALVGLTQGKSYAVQVRGPQREPVEGSFGILGDGRTAIVEMAENSGLRLAGGGLKNNPLTATTYGVGEAMLAALAKGGIEKIIVCIGGSASTDGGIGALGALGYRFLDKDDAAVDAAMGGGVLSSVARIDAVGVSPLLRGVSLEVACDVANTPYGPSGAAAIFGPQKGANAQQIALLDAGVKNLCDIFARPLSEGGLGVDLSQMPGGGAAGALGMGLAAIGAILKPGFELVAQATGLAAEIERAVFIVTAEGKLDHTSLTGKAPVGVLRLARKAGTSKYVAGIGGNLSDDEALFAAGFDYLDSTVTEAVAWDDAKAHSRMDIERAAARMARNWVNMLYRAQGLDHTAGRR